MGLQPICIFSGKKQESKMYMWGEHEAKRGVNEVICLDNYIRCHMLEKVNDFVIFTDGCPGQNLHYTMVHYLLGVTRSLSLYHTLSAH